MCQYTWLGDAAPLFVFFPVIDNVLPGEPRCLLDECGRGAPRCSFMREYVGGSSSSLEDMLFEKANLHFPHSGANQLFKNFPETPWCKRTWAQTHRAWGWLEPKPALTNATKNGSHQSDNKNLDETPFRSPGTAHCRISSTLSHAISSLKKQEHHHPLLLSSIWQRRVQKGSARDLVKTCWHRHRKSALNHGVRCCSPTLSCMLDWQGADHPDLLQ
jgi:hypothetical protein